MAKKGKMVEERPIEPRFSVRWLAEWYWTLLTAGGLAVVLSGWQIWNKLNQEELWRREIPTPLYFYLAAGLLLCGATYAVRYLLGVEVAVAFQRRQVHKEARALRKEARRCLRWHGRRLSSGVRGEVEGAVKAIDQALAPLKDASDWGRLEVAMATLDGAIDQHLAFARKSSMRESVESVGGAVLIALLLRAFVFEAFKIPSGSMIPTLQVGDHLFVNKFIYGIRLPWPFDETEFGKAHQKFFMDLRKPQRGEVIVFKYPKDPDKDFIKRIVAVEGDQLEIKENQLVINGQAIERVSLGPCEYDDFKEDTGRWEHDQCESFRETLDSHPFTAIYERGRATQSWPSWTVPPGHVFVMGDNRDNSHDSRYWGFVPFELIKGKAMFIWWSSGEPEGIRIGRMGHAVE